MFLVVSAFFVSSIVIEFELKKKNRYILNHHPTLHAIPPSPQDKNKYQDQNNETQREKTAIQK